MKKALSFIIAVLMVMSLFTATASAAAFTVTWDKSNIGEIAFTRQAAAEKYFIVLYKDSMPVHNVYDVRYYGAGTSCSWYFGEEMEMAGDGKYEAVVSYVDASGNIVTAMSEVFEYKRPSQYIQKPVNVKLNTTTGIARWSPVNGAYYYSVSLCYRLPDEEVFNEYHTNNSYETYIDFSEYGELDEFYDELEWIASDWEISINEIETAICVQAFHQKLNTYASSFSDFYSFKGTSIESRSSQYGQVSDLKIDKYTSGKARFIPAENICFYEMDIYKDGELVEKSPIYNRDKQAYYEMESSLSKYAMAKLGEGKYQFTIKYAGDKIEQSNVYEYNPGKKLTAPSKLALNDNSLTWECNDSEVMNYAVAIYLTYGNSDYEFIADREYVRNQYFEVEERWLNDYKVRVEYNHAKDSVNKNKKDAKIAYQVYSIPRSSTYSVGASNYLVDGVEVEVEVPEKELTQVDRSSITDARYVESAKIVYDLGLMENIYENPTATITKGEFCEIAVKMLGAEDVAKGMKDSSSIFSDVTTDTDLNGYVRYLCNKGIINGDGTGAFGVATEMTYAQILKVLVSITGYEVYAQSSGGYPTGYLTAASSAKITSGVALDEDSTVTREQMGRLAANTIETKLMEAESFTVQGPIYKKTDKTLLFDYMGYVRILGTGYATGNEISIEKNILFSKDYPKGIPSADVEIENTDYDAMELNGKRTMFYVKDSKNVCSIQYYGGQVVINNGDTETSNRNVTLTIKADGYTKYKIGDGAYSPITSTVSYKLAETDGTQTVRITLANDDESRTQNVSDSIVLNNKHKITYKANGRVFKTVEVGCGKSVPVMTERPSFTGYRFDGWETQAPSVMPDYDIVINAKMTPITTVTGKVIVNGVPVEGANVWIGEDWYTQTDANGEFSFDMERGHQTITIKYNNMSKSVFCEFKEATLDLGEITLTAESTEIKVTEESITSVSGAEKLFDEEDKEYVKTEGNVVSVKVDVKPAQENTNIAQKEAETSYRVETLVDIDIIKVKSGAENSQKEINETNNLLEFKFVIPAESRGKSSYAVLREHCGMVDMLTTVPNADGEYIVINQDVIVVYAKKFSIYALATKEVVSAEKTSDGVELTINLNEQVVADNALMIVKAYDKKGVQLTSKTILVTSIYSDTVYLECEGATGYKLMFWSGLEKIKPCYAVIDGSL